MRQLCLALLALAGALGPVRAQVAVSLMVELEGTPSIVFDTAHDGCTPDDMPDLNARAFRDATGRTVMFALYDINRPLTGPDVDHLKIDCHISLGSPHDPDPAHFADRNFVTATWTDDGQRVSALVHEEYHADQHGRCRVSGDLACWYNTIVAYHSADGGQNFVRSKPFVVAAAPFEQDIEQGRHRGFFNPSNIVAQGPFRYALISTTGWTGQFDGVCLFRSGDPASGGWSAFDGRAYTIRYTDPYGAGLHRTKPHSTTPCATLAPFVFPVGSITYHRASRTWIALFQAKATGAMPLDGFYYATSRDLIHWGEPRILLAGPTLYDDLCRAGPSIINYPSVLDPASPSRNYDEVGDAPELFFTKMEVTSCHTGRRLLLRQRLAIHWTGRS